MTYKPQRGLMSFLSVSAVLDTSADAIEFSHYSLHLSAYFSFT